MATRQDPTLKQNPGPGTQRDSEANTQLAFAHQQQRAHRSPDPSIAGIHTRQQGKSQQGVFSRSSPDDMP
ncbi:hypothetical protein FRC06_006582, partial [Ceratobasidium sp. 370]